MPRSTCSLLLARSVEGYYGSHISACVGLRCIAQPKPSVAVRIQASYTTPVFRVDMLNPRKRSSTDCSGCDATVSLVLTRSFRGGLNNRVPGRGNGKAYLVPLGNQGDDNFLDSLNGGLHLVAGRPGAQVVIVSRN